MGYAKITPEQKRIFWAHRKQGWKIADACTEAGFSLSTGKALSRGVKSLDGRAAKVQQAVDNADRLGPIPLDRLCPEAQRGLEDIGYFSLRYFGLVLMPWQIEATQKIVALQASPDEEYAVINCPPGSGKSTFFTLVLPAWLTCRDRTIRGLVGSASHSTAKWYLGRLRSAFARTTPVQAKPREIKLGIAVDAETTLLADYGVFKPATEERWASDAFSVAQHNDVALSEKEHTWMAFGRSSTFLGARVDFQIWDDVYDPAQLRTIEARELMREWWTGNVETRLEPGGLLILQGQRKDAADIYRFALDKKQFSDDDLDEDDTGAAMYHHIRFQAHYDDLCTGDHTNPKPYPDGCLLYPKRLSYRKLMRIKGNDNATFEIEYQQQDTAPSDVLVDKIWVSGGTDSTGAIRWGCWDNDRACNTLPKNLKGPLFSIATIDPSPKRFWGIQHYVVAPNDNGQVFLMDLLRAKLRGSDVLDWVHEEGEFVGVMEDWQTRSERLGFPITDWIIEANAAQSWFYADDKGRRWVQRHNVNIHEHVTGGKKNDPDYGVYMLREPWRSGRIRIPGLGNSRLTSLQLVDEVTRYPHGGTDDQVMAQWFLFAHLADLAVKPDENTRLSRPSWATEIPDARRLMAV